MMAAKKVKEKRRTRVVSIAVASCLSHEPAVWKLLLSQLWVESTTLANWSLVEWIKAEPQRRPEDEKMGPLPGVYHYGLLQDYHRVRYWEGAKASANCILQAVRKRWLKDRYAVMWQRRQAPPLFRYPYPYRVHAQSWRLDFDTNGQPHLCASFPGGKAELLLRSGQEYRRQIAQLREIVAGHARGLELLIDKNRKTGQVICRIVASFKMPAPSAHDGVMHVATCADRFFRVESDNGPDWLLNADHVRRWVLSHAQYLQRIAEDTKHEKRWPHRMRRHINEARAARCVKQHCRLDSWIKQACAQVVGLAMRRRCGTIVFDDSCKSYFQEFPWHALRERLACKCVDAGILFQPSAAPAVGAESTS